MNEKRNKNAQRDRRIQILDLNVPFILGDVIPNALYSVVMSLSS